MRNFEERKAEVFRRSEKRIKERKQRRNHILMACIPLALCITILSAFLRPNVTPDGAADPGEGQHPVSAQIGIPMEPPGPSCSVAGITVSGNGLSLSVTEVSELLPICDMLYSCSAGAPATNSATSPEAVDMDPEDNAEDVSGSIADSANAVYTITLVMHDGQETEYRLSGNTLRNLITDQSHTLTQTQGKELRELLGIPQP